MKVCNLTLALLALCVLLSSCGGSITPPPTDNNNETPRVERVWGPGMPVATPDNVEVLEDGKLSSAVYRRFWGDSVNQHSGGRWTTSNAGGFKQWTLSNTAWSAPKAWLMGGNYWNNEDDSLSSNAFTIPDGTDGIRVTFYARWSISEGDTGSVWWWTDGTPELVTSFSGGQNPDYPSWTKYYFELPANFSGFDTTNNLEFLFESDSSVNNWGFAIDSVAVYQRGLEAPLNLSATDGNFSIQVSWDYPDTGTLIPDAVDIYRSLTSGSGYEWVATVGHPGTLWTDDSALSDTDYYYVAVCTKSGWLDSDQSNEDVGWYTFGGP